MSLLGRISLIIGLIITLVSLIGGFWIMFQGNNDELAKQFFVAVPLGFLLLFAGVATIVMFSPRDSDR